MTENRNSLIRKLLSNIPKAIAKGLVYYVIFYFVPMLLLSQLTAFVPDLFTGYGPIIDVFIATIIFFAVASELSAGTILQHFFNIGRALVVMMFIAIALDGGVLILDFHELHITADVRLYLFMLLTVDFLSLAKAVLQAIHFLSGKVENDEITIPSI